MNWLKYPENKPEHNQLCVVTGIGNFAERWKYIANFYDASKDSTLSETEDKNFQAFFTEEDDEQLNDPTHFAVLTLPE